jgi:oxygen-independent coproporphyrinogen-3 oxidase
MSSLYIHIPFCVKKCNYCSFVSFPLKDTAFEQYFCALKKEFDAKAKGQLSTVYFGGGTPSVIPVEFYKQFDFDFAPDYEFTFEVNPGTVDTEYLQALRSIGVNRLSIGIQSFDDEILKSIGRIHSAKEAINCVKMAQEAGFENISIDLIYGLPNQTMELFEDSLKQAINLGVQHISTYGLKIEEGTPFGQKTPENLPDEDLCADMYLTSIEMLEENGFKQYEISNFAKKSKESRHNMTYWQNSPYIALGVSAHGYQDGIRYYNTSDFKKYLKNPIVPEFAKKLTEEEILQEGIFLGLRMKQGINLNEFKLRYGVDFEEEYKDILKKYDEFFIRKGNRISLTTQGLMLSNVILSEFI